MSVYHHYIYGTCARTHATCSSMRVDGGAKCFFFSTYSRASIPDLKLTSRMQMVSHQDKEVVSASKEHSRTDASLDRKAQTCVENTAERHISSGDADNASLDKGDDSGKDGDDKEEVESNDGSPPVADPAGKC